MQLRCGAIYPPPPMQIDVEGYDAAALWGLRRVVEAALPPILKLEFALGDVNGTSGCDVIALLRWAYGLRYSAYSLGWPATHPPSDRAYTLADFETLIVPSIITGKDAPLRAAGVPWFMGELLFVHDTAPVPAVFKITGPGGRSPV
jgi:hypothetical protein